jgi:hypothetical protein
VTHSMDNSPCSACGDLDGCHIPAKVRRHPDSVMFGQACPEIVCLCGSTRFRQAFELAMKEETLEGNIVLSVGLMGHEEGLDMDGPVKAMLDELHKRKIDLARVVRVVSVDGYIGSSTRGEIDYAVATGKRLRWGEAKAEQTYREGCK